MKCSTSISVFLLTAKCEFITRCLVAFLYLSSLDHDNTRSCIRKMKPLDPIGKIGDSSAFQSSPRFLPLPFRSIPYGTDRFDRDHSLLPSLVRHDKLSSLPFPLLLPGEQGRESTAGNPSRSVHAGNGCRCTTVVDPVVSHVL